MAAKMATMFGDVTGLQQRHPPIKYILSCWEDQMLSTEGKIVSKYCNISKNSEDGFHQPPLVPRWGYDFPCTSEGLDWLGMTTSAVILDLTKPLGILSPKPY